MINTPIFDPSRDKYNIRSCPEEWVLTSGPRTTDPLCWRGLIPLGACQLDVGQSHWTSLRLHSFPWAAGEGSTYRTGWWPPTQNLPIPVGSQYQPPA